MRHLNIIVVVLLSYISMNAQVSTTTTTTTTDFTKAKHNGLELGLLGGGLIYTGDTHCENFFFKQAHVGYGAFARYYFGDRLSARLNLITGKIAGDDAKYPDRTHGSRDFSFTSTLFDASAMLEFEPWGAKRYRADNTFKRILSPYFNVGAGFLSGKPVVNFNEQGNLGIAAEIALDKANAKSTFFNIPFGGGIRYDLTRNLTLGAEAAFRMPFTDYLDGISQSANSSKNDWYYTGLLNLGYRFKYKRDADGDGIADEEDTCPNEVGSAEGKGCPDIDGDGVIDRLDNCPQERGIVSLNGCPDRDSDGIADKDDACPDQAGEATYNGCPDRDGDGIVDSKDECPDAKGSVALGGCPDTDGDGIVDKMDACPREKGTKADNGCPAKDIDQDGIADKDDLCPDRAGTRENNGCPSEASSTISSGSSSSSSSSSSTIVRNDGMEISPDAVVVGTFVDNSSVVKAGSDVIISTNRVVESTRETIPSNAVYTGTIGGATTTVSSSVISTEETAVFEEALYGIEFETGSAVIKSSSYSILNRVLGVMQRRSDAAYEISGHTDNVGNSAANMRLSEARARAVYTYLVGKGISSSRLSPRGYGDTNPVADNGSAAGRTKNRRVQFNVR
jgi:OmpA-OmpF porin, OOP family